MKTINLLKAGAVLTASAFLLSVSVYDFKGVLSDDTYNKKSDAILPVVTVLENTTSSDYETANVQLLLNAYEEKNNEDMAVICDKLLESIEASKKEFEQTSQIVAEWNNDAITARLEKYQNEFNVKSAETINALNEVKNSINVEENLTVISDNLFEEDEYHYSDAVPNIESSIDEIITLNTSLKNESVDIASPQPTSNDLDYSILTKHPDVIKAIADEFGDINELYLFVRNSIEYETYSCSKKDPVITIEQLGGNDLDQAALLAALLRAKNIPARFVEGTIELTAEQAISITGAKNAEIAGRLLATYGNSITGLTVNGELVGYRMKRVWIEAYIPYTDYRGAGNKTGESIWVQLDPSFKNVIPTAEAITPEFSENDKETLSLVQNMAEQYPNIVGEDAYSIPDTIDFHYSVIEQVNDLYVPSTLPYTVLSVEERYTAISSADKDSISITINGEDIFSAPVSELCYDKINVSYEPASETDEKVMDNYEKITDVPAYLVNVVPVVTVGDEKYYGEFETSLGSMQQMVTTINNNGRRTMLNDSIYSGSMYAINLNLQRISANEAQQAHERIKEAYDNCNEKYPCSTDTLGTVLDYAGKYYFSLCDVQSSLYSGIMNIDATKQLGFAITGYQFTRSSVFGIVKSLDSGSFYIDVAYNSVSAVNLDGDKEAEKKYMTTVGTLESYFEGYIWEDITDCDSVCISTVSVLNMAHNEGISSRFICKKNLEDELSLCNVSDSVKNEVRDFVNQGLVIEIVPETLTIGDWTGTAYIAINLNNGSASYMISGGNAGGSSMNYSFEDLFSLNNTLALINTEMAASSLAMGTANLYSSMFSGNGMGIVKGAHSCIGAAFSIGSAINMRYSTYDFIFEYAEKGEDCMKDFMIFTIENLIDTLINAIAFVGSVVGEVGGPIGKAADFVTGWLSTEYSYTKHFANIFDGDSDYPGAMDTIALIWDLIGKLL